jgi:UDP-GlcNAc:undecaprenyl-phosphate GlcNAc-1-phosphate transferase
MSELDAIYAFLAAGVVTALLTPLTARAALRIGAVDEPRERGLSSRSTPLLGGLAILAGAVAGASAGGLLGLPSSHLWRGVLLAACVITLVGALDDLFDLPPVWKLAGQTTAALIAVHYGVVVHHITLPFIGDLDFPHTGSALTLIALVGLMNIVNFSDGVDGLAAGVSVIIATVLAIIAFDLHRNAAGVLAALTAGAALGFLFHNFPPASSFMGDSGSNLLGLLMGALTVEGAVKTQVVISFAIPLILLAVPFLDTTFVVLKRLKYRRPIAAADNEHFHHRMARIGFTPRRTLVYLYAWTVMLAGLALALRFVPYSDHHGHLYTGWSLVMAAIGLVVAAASVYLVYLLEILKFRRLDALRLRRQRPAVTEAEIEASVVRQLETGEFHAVGDPAP